MSQFTPPNPELIENLKAVVGTHGWKTAKDAGRYFDDPRGRFKGQGALIVAPSNTQQVAQIVRMCNAARVGIVPFSGGTGVVAGQMSIDSANAIILSLEKMNKVRDVSVDDGVLVAEAGCILENIHNVALSHDMVFPLSMASKGSCCIGGNLATNAGGIQVLRYGNARDLCLGIEAVLPNGEILSELNPLRKNNTGYDLRHMLIGSEGTLGVITAASLLLKASDPERTTVFCALDSPTAAKALFRKLRDDVGDGISAFELMSGFGLNLVTHHFPQLRSPFSEAHPWYALIEITGHLGIRARVEAALEGCFEAEILNDAVLATSEQQRDSLWDLREYTPEANKLTGAICNSDTAVPISQVDRFLKLTTKAISDVHEGLRINSYGHIGDGNIHHNVFPPEDISKHDLIANHPGIIDAVRMAINETTDQCGGSISAEHGIGRLKVDDLEQYVSVAKRDMMRAIKRAVDPNNIMNPGALLRIENAE
ncbi:MAG: FAD-binding oxidoreductase [Litoreibacter sp.]